jgi:hypothetical protein
MRLDGYIPFTALPERSTRPVVPAANSEPVRAGQTASAAPVEPVRSLVPRAVSAASANAEYIPARRESQEPVYGRSNQASTTNPKVFSVSTCLLDPLLFAEPFFADHR